MAKLGLSYRKVKPRKRTLGAYRLEVIRDFLIEYDKYYKLIEEGKDYVFVFMDESYVHSTHSSERSFMPQDNNLINKPSGKGTRLIILHAITKFGPLTELDDVGRPIYDLIWRGPKKGTCQPRERSGPDDPAKINCETLWIAQSKTGDYHENMNSDNYMKWVRKKLLPCFDQLFPGKRMVFVADNAPYHHAREIGALGGLTKPKLTALMVKHGCTYLDIPESDKRNEMFADDEVKGVSHLPNKEVYRLAFNKAKFEKRAGTAAAPFVPSTTELQLGFVNWLKENKPELLECKFEKEMKAKGHNILWTPPYCPDLQPIETFWAVGKNHVADKYYDGRSMIETVADLREGWYGNHFPKIFGPQLPKEK